jgi:hypothetical protein
MITGQFPAALPTPPPISLNGEKRSLPLHMCFLILFLQNLF